MLLLFWGTSAYSQNLKIPDYSFETGALAAAGKQTPFWLISNQNGMITSNRINAWIRLGLKTHLSNRKEVDYDYGLDIIDRQSNATNKLYLNQAYIRLKLYFINFQAGSMVEKFGNQDSSLSSGGLLWSGNARPIPKITMIVPEFTAVPFTQGYLEFKGGISHGWFGDNQFINDSWLHHKYLYLRLGGRLPVHLHFGLHHFAQWGGTSTDPAVGKLTGNFSDFIKVFFAKNGDHNAISNEQLNALGNHLGSRNFGIDVDLPNLKAGFYWQTIFEDSSGREFMNIKDGLWGVYLRMKDKDRFINGLVYEFVNTTDQSGPNDSYWLLDGIKYYYPVPGGKYHWPIGNDDYFNNYLYQFGWTYNGMTIGTPLITSPEMQKIDKNESEYIWNNKVICHHFGLEGKYRDIHYKMLATYTLNYGTNFHPFEKALPQFSFLLETQIPNKLPWGIIGSLKLGVDFGKLYGNNAGLLLSLLKKGNF